MKIIHKKKTKIKLPNNTHTSPYLSISYVFPLMYGLSQIVIWTLGNFQTSTGIKKKKIAIYTLPRQLVRVPCDNVNTVFFSVTTPPILTRVGARMNTAVKRSCFSYQLKRSKRKSTAMYKAAERPLLQWCSTLPGRRDMKRKAGYRISSLRWTRKSAQICTRNKEPNLN